ncbi:hypothetical protein LUZ62_087669 [Rhynchospora pubera]|uniref:Uncharacterized protein n=1 Tax=Rhynchospora pubera TaxID=906938 RepID=A0AAV8CEL7_9POAL|nr:hypothetical protein LUZ62_087669 [Rhynchospora pubera]
MEMEVVAPAKQDPPLTTTSSSSGDVAAITNPFEFDFPAPDSNGVSNPFEFPPASPTSRRSNPFMDDLSPTSPRRSINPFDFFCHYTSAPSSPNRAATIYAELKSEEDSFLARASFSTSSKVPFDWEEKPGTPKSPLANSEKSITSSPEFEFNAPVEENAPKTDLTTADELFEEGKIRPLKPPPRLQLLGMDESRTSMSANSSPRSAKSWALLSPRVRAKSDFDPFAVALAVATTDRGREEKVRSSHARKVSRSLSPSPLGRGNLLEEKINSFKSSTPAPLTETSSIDTVTSKSSSNRSRKKWRLSDLLLFRNASEGRRVAGNRSKDPIFKYSPSGIFNGSPVSPSPAAEKKVGGGDETKKHSSLGLKGMKGGKLFMKKPTTTVNEKQQNLAMQDDQKKKNYVPIRQGVFSCIRLNPSMNRLVRGMNTHHLSKEK